MSGNEGIHYICSKSQNFTKSKNKNKTQDNSNRKLSLKISLQWRNDGRGGVSNHQPHHCLLNRLFRRRSKKASKLRITGFAVTGEFPAQMASNAVNISIWWRHYDRLSKWGLYYSAFNMLSRKHKSLDSSVLTLLFNPGHDLITQYNSRAVCFHVGCGF